ncbi:hydrogenase formation protein HypD [Rubripirellula reticaptiva]|uniref:Hydrogenase isoenzymes formation protein HypD n=1 Tax=Rubripirellula reticaptiva TaxID=2528013 RepID=A0A5C6EGJ3_9BACT|nr:hydrogenase formation protein HypD [Rubripirellula reticaptiva]TWU46706.1 Hydrogenase isoenzymes formation protein HypD [Rubripirellula reticaptiva]
MKYLSEFRNVSAAKILVQQIRDRATRRWVLMDVCGGQTHSLVRYGIEQELEEHVDLIHGPGCPVCVTSTELIDFAVSLSLQPDTIVASFGDMIRVPGSRDSLMQARSRGGNVKIVYSPVDAVLIAAKNPQSQIVFFAVGFETTAPATAIAILQAAKLGLQNFSVLPAHVRVLPAMQTIMEMPGNRVEAFLAAGHVCSVTGFAQYEPFVSNYKVPVVVTGFEPVDLLGGILRCVEMLEQGICAVDNRYGRSVCRAGNESAQAIINRVYMVDDRDWRGFGTISGGGYRLRSEFANFDAAKRFERCVQTVAVESLCRGGDVMSGRIKPKQCPAFGVGCTPESPMGAPMVSSEGACAAYYRFDPLQLEKPR